MKKYKRVKIWINLIKCYFMSFKGSKAIILNSEETIEYLIKENKSLIRFGDGEFNLFLKKDIHYQKWSYKLLEDIKMIKEYFEENKENSEYILAVPYIFLKKSGLFLARRRVYVSSWSFARYIFKNNFTNKNIKYGDSFAFSINSGSIKDKLFSNKKDVIFVHNNKKYSDNFSRLYNRRTYFVQCSNKNAYEQIDKLLESIDQCIKENKLDKKNLDIIISAGPAGKVIAFRMSKKGYRCLDTGHCWDDPLIID